jgi:hypothetical protein
MSIPTDFTEPVGIFAQFVLDCAASAATVIDPKFVFVGHYEWFAEQNFYHELVKEYPAWQIFIGSPLGSADNFDMNGKFQCIAELFYSIPADRPSDYIPLMIMQAKLVKAWATNFTWWTRGGNRNPRSVDWGDPHIRRHEKPKGLFVVSTKFVLHSGIFSVPVVTDPPLVPAVVGD